MLKAGQTQRVDFAAIAGFPVSGAVTQAGKPVAGARVSVNSLSSRSWIASVKTDVEGRYRISHLSPGRYSLSVQLGDRTPGKQPARQQEQVEVKDGPVTMDFVFGTGKIVGRVVDKATGEPLKGARVMVSLHSEGDGRRPMYLVPYRRPGKGLSFTFSPRRLGGAAPGSLLAASPLGRFAGRVPAGYASVDEEGRFEIADLAQGKYRVSCYRKDGVNPSHFSLVDLGQDAGVKELTLTVDTSHSLRIRVESSQTKGPMAGARLVIHTHDGLYVTSHVRVDPKKAPKPQAAGAKPSPFQPITTSAQGEAAVHGLLPGRYAAWVVAEGHGARWVSPIESQATDGSASTVTVALEPTGTFLLQPAQDLLDEDKTPAVVYRLIDGSGKAVFPGGQLVPLVLDTGVGVLDGEYAKAYPVNTVPPGRYQLKWELYLIGDHAEPFRTQLADALAARGETQVHIQAGKQTVVLLAGKP